MKDKSKTLVLRDLARTMLSEARSFKYDMKYINGGFSNGVKVEPSMDGATAHVSVDIYGGGQSQKIPIQVPPKIQQLITAVSTAEQRGDPAAVQLRDELNAYYRNIKKLIGFKMVKLFEQMDAQAGQLIAQAVSEINAKYEAK
jgi:hypothetical protein